MWEGDTVKQHWIGALTIYQRGNNWSKIPGMPLDQCPQDRCSYLWLISQQENGSPALSRQAVQSDPDG